MVLFFAWGGLTALAYPDPWADAGAAPLALRAAAGLSYVLACFASCFFVFAAAIRFGGERFGGAKARLLDSLKANAFGMYLVHYVFIVWLQFALLGLELPGSRQGGDRVRRHAGAELVGHRGAAPGSGRRQHHRRRPPPRHPSGVDPRLAGGIEADPVVVAGGAISAQPATGCRLPPS